MSFYLNQFSKGLHHDAIENTHYFVGTVGHRHRFAPRPCFGNTEGMLSENVCSNVVFGTNDQQGQNARIGVDRLN